MVPKRVIIAPIIYEYRDRHPKESCKRVQNVHSQHNSEAVKSAYYRWNSSGQKIQDTKRSDSVSKNNGTILQKGKKGGSAGKERITPTNLTKIDKHTLEEYLLCLIDFENPDVRVAREIANFVNPKSGMIQEEKVKVEFIGVNKDEQIALAEAYRADIESKIPR